MCKPVKLKKYGIGGSVFTNLINNTEVDEGISVNFKVNGCSNANPPPTNNANTLN